MTVPGALIDGKYRIVRELGAGGMGTVFLAEHTFLARNVALKLLKRELMSQPGMAARFQLEAQAASRLDHPNIVRVSDFGRTDDEQPYLVMELLEGHPLSAETKGGRSVGRQRALFVAAELARGLEHAHRAGVVHRDLKPENVFIDSLQRVKIVDFGLAKLLEPRAGTKLTHTGSVMGTPEYMSPEQARGESDLDARADLYALGVILYELLSGGVPYQGANYNVVIYEILTGQPRPIAVAAPGIEPDLAGLVMRAIAPRREDRFQTAGELLAALTALSPSLPLAAGERPTREVPASPREGTSPTLPAAPARVLGAEAIALAVAGAEAIPLDRPPPEPPPAAPPAPTEKGRSRAPLVIGLLLALVVAAGGIVGWRMLGAPPPPPRSVKVLLHGATPKTRLLIDGRPVSGNPLVVAGDRELHELTVEQPGRAPRVYAFRPTTDQYIEIE